MGRRVSTSVVKASSARGNKKKNASCHVIGIIFNLKTKGTSADSTEEYDEIETIDALQAEIERLGFRVMRVEQTGDWIGRLKKEKVEFVVNIAEGRGVTRNRESQVPAMLEYLGIPYSGSDALSLGVTLDKRLTTLLLKAGNIPVPEQYMVCQTQEIAGLQELFKQPRTLIVKPRWEGSSKGIFLNNVVSDYASLRGRVTDLLAAYKQPVLVEEFLEGDEITAAVCGNGANLRLLGMMRISNRDPKEKRFIYSIETKRDWQEKVKYEGQEAITALVRQRVQDSAFRAFRALELRDISRIDFRLAADGTPKVIDINPLPGLSPHYSDLPILFRLQGDTYADLVRMILAEALQRNGLDWLD